MNRPNILYVFADQWRAEATGFGGNGDVRTPQLDQFARSAAHCPLAVANIPVCTPSRATFLTGFLPDRHGLFLNDAPLSPDIRTLGEHFSEAGYDTAYIGKWHVDGHGRSDYIPPERQHGFQYWKALECTHAYNESAYYEGDNPDRKQWEGYDAIAQTADACHYLRERKDEAKPFLMVLSWGPPHNPYETAPAEYRDLYDPTALTLRPNVPAEKHAHAREMLSGYYAHCTALDTCFGNLVATLEETGLTEDTIVVFTSDHGDHLGSHGLREKQSPLEESLRVPFLLRWPGGGITGGENRSLIGTLDHFPTLCGLAGVASPSQVQGRDLSHHLREGSTPPPEENDAFCASYHPFGTWLDQTIEGTAPEAVRCREYRGIRTERHTYCEDLNGPWLLFDNVADPFQLTNLAGDAGAAVVHEELQARLRARLAAYEDDFLPGIAYIRRWGYEVNERGTVPTRK